MEIIKLDTFEPDKFEFDTFEPDNKFEFDTFELDDEETDNL